MCFLPVGHESVVLPTEHDSNIGCVVDRGVKVSVVADVSWQVHFHGGKRNQGSKEIFGVILNYKRSFSELSLFLILLLPN